MPILHELDQRSEAWLQLRAGIPSSSNFGKIITPKTMKLSSQADGYANKLIAELLLGRPVMSKGSEWMERGSVLEGEAIRSYEFENNVSVKRIGFITDDAGKYGCSPDFLVGDNGMGEIKCLEEAHHVGHLLSGEIEAEHKPQIQGQLFIAEREWNDWHAFHHTNLPTVTIRCYRDEEYIKKLAACLEEFWDIMLGKIEILKKRGLM